VPLPDDHALTTLHQRVAPMSTSCPRKTSGAPSPAPPVPRDLQWVVAPPGSGLTGAETRTNPWRGPVEEYGSGRQVETDLSTVADLLPSVEPRARDLHRRAIGRLDELVASGERTLSCGARSANSKAPFDVGPASVVVAS